MQINICIKKISPTYNHIQISVCYVNIHQHKKDLTSPVVIVAALHVDQRPVWHLLKKYLSTWDLLKKYLSYAAGS